MSDEMVVVREVTNLNWPEELTLMADVISDYDYVAFDTEYPDLLCSTPREDSDDERYGDLKSNVEATDFMQLLKLGITFIGNDGSVPHRCWQFTLEDMDPATNPYLLVDNPKFRANGFKFGKRLMSPAECIKVGLAGDILNTLKSEKRDRGGIKWVTFHGLYNAAYLLKVVKCCRLPDALPGFAEAVGKGLGDVYDVKHMSRDLCLGREIGLAELAKALGVRFDGGQHQQAGYNSLMTAKVFTAMRCAYGSRFDRLLARSVGLVHGMKSARIEREEETGVRKRYSWGRTSRGDNTFFKLHFGDKA